VRLHVFFFDFFKGKVRFRWSLLRGCMRECACSFLRDLLPSVSLLFEGKVVIELLVWGTGVNVKVLLFVRPPASSFFVFQRQGEVCLKSCVMKILDLFTLRHCDKLLLSSLSDMLLDIMHVYKYMILIYICVC
jgi:hypothetical protein